MFSRGDEIMRGEVKIGVRKEGREGEMGRTGRKIRLKVGLTDATDTLLSRCSIRQ